MDRLRLRQLINEFVVLAVDAIPDDEEEEFTVEEMLKSWADDPECMLSPMFIGYMLGEGEDINAFCPEALHLAVITELELMNSNVEFDWIGACDATSKPN